MAGPGEHDASGDEIVRIGIAHLGETYVLGARAPMANANWRGPWDCAEFASWCVFQATGVLYGVNPAHDPIRADAYTGYWAEQATRDGAQITIDQAARIPGACVVRIPGSGALGHIAISDGMGGTIEAHSTNKGVIRSVIAGRRWDIGVLVPGVAYHSLEDVIVIPAQPETLRVTTPLMRGPRIQAVQSRLQILGYEPGNIDGIYGPQTAYAVQAFQHDHGLVADGEVGAQTIAALIP